MQRPHEPIDMVSDCEDYTSNLEVNDYNHKN